MDIADKPTQVRIIGTGSYLKIEITGGVRRSTENPFGQVSINLFRIWGRPSSLNVYRLRNDQSKTKLDRTRINKILLELGADFSFETGKEVFYSKKFWKPIDMDSRECFQGLIQRKAELIKREDFAALKALRNSAEEVLRIGGEIFDLQAELESCLLKEKFEEAEELKRRIRALALRRDNIDALFETERFDRFVVFDRESSEEYRRRIEKRDNILLKQLEEERQRKLAVMEERQRLGRDNYRDEIPVKEPESAPEQNMDDQPTEEPEKKSPVKKKPYLIRKRGKEVTKKVKKDEMIVSSMKNDNNQDQQGFFNRNQGDRDLEAIFDPLKKKAGVNAVGNSEEESHEFLSRMSSLGLLNVFGVGVWSAICHSNWKMREASIEAVLEYVKRPLNKRFIGKTKKLFLSCCELSKAVCEDKVMSIYLLGLQLLALTIREPICGSDIDSATFSRVIADFTPVLIQKISEINQRTKDLSMHTLISFFKHPLANIEQLFASITDICSKERETVLYNIQKQPVDKLPGGVVTTRLKILLQAQLEFGDKADFIPVLKLLALPGLSHTDLDARTCAAECFVMFYQVDPLAAREMVSSQQNNINPYLLENLLERFELVDRHNAQKANTIKPSNLSKANEMHLIQEDLINENPTESIS